MVRPSKRKGGESETDDRKGKKDPKRPHREDDDEDEGDGFPPTDDDGVNGASKTPEEVAAQAKQLKEQATEQVAYDVQLEEKALEKEFPPTPVIDKDSILYRSLYKRASEPKNKAAILYVAFQEGRLDRAPTEAELLMRASLASAMDSQLGGEGDDDEADDSSSKIEGGGEDGDELDGGVDADRLEAKRKSKADCSKDDKASAKASKEKKNKKKVSISLPPESDSSDDEGDDYETDYDGAGVSLTKKKKKKKKQRAPSSSSSSDESSDDESDKRKRKKKKKKASKRTQARSLVLHAAALRAKAGKKAKKKKKKSKRRRLSSSSSSSSSSSEEDRRPKEAKVKEVRASWIHPFTPLVKSVPGEKDTTPEVQSECYFI